MKIIHHKFLHSFESFFTFRYPSLATFLTKIEVRISRLYSYACCNWFFQLWKRKNINTMWRINKIHLSIITTLFNVKGLVRQKSERKKKRKKKKKMIKRLGQCHRCSLSLSLFSLLCRLVVILEKVTDLWKLER